MTRFVFLGYIPEVQTNYSIKVPNLRCSIKIQDVRPRCSIRIYDLSISYDSNCDEFFEI